MVRRLSRTFVILPCGFEACDRKIKRVLCPLGAGQNAFCSEQCHSSQRLLAYAREVMPLKLRGDNHRQIAQAMGGYNKGVAARRWNRFRKALQRYPILAALCISMDQDLLNAGGFVEIPR